MENNIGDIRKALALSQEDLAKKTGVSRQTINAIENNHLKKFLSMIKTGENDNELF
ncbi:MAG: helix-turn-helix domain-containing protein [Proteobacteria bacterium]|nr:helix-turn-helix domain-containing protein [Pseudomonadota bacterium]